MGEEQRDQPAMSFEEFRRSFHYGDHADMQFKYLAKLSDEAAADTIAELLQLLGEAFDTGDFEPLHRAAFESQVRGYAPDEPPEPEVDVAPFTPLGGPLSERRVALMSAGGVFVVDDDPMGPDGPTQQEALSLITEFLRGTPTLSRISVDTPPERLTARHPGYDARIAQRDIDTVFPLSHLRDLAEEGRLLLAEEHYGYVGATSHTRLREEVAPRWAERLAGQELDAVFLVAT